MQQTMSNGKSKDATGYEDREPTEAEIMAEVTAIESCFDVAAWLELSVTHEPVYPVRSVTRRKEMSVTQGTISEFRKFVRDLIGEEVETPYQEGQLLGIASTLTHLRLAEGGPYSEVLMKFAEEEEVEN